MKTNLLERITIEPGKCGTQVGYRPACRVKFWVDAQLPPLFATWLSEQFNVEAFSLKSLGLRDATDAAIFRAAQQPGIVLNQQRQRLCRAGLPIRAELAINMGN